ncbi:MAG: Bax inhibitor-1/YccA family protein [Chitinophagaceae bacterium]|jgi:uncharacterized YccA/Bax inhibitor family protein|nr:Bax inhibitor-1/YccA family protein [Chitinophagaceae bacterium]
MFEKSGNPVLGEKTFGSISLSGDTANRMTIQGTINKTGMLLLLVLGAAYYTWSMVAKGQNAMPFMLGGAIGGFVIALVTVFKKEWSAYTSPAYAICQGLFVGGISAMYNYAFAEKMPNIITNAVGLTLSVAVAMFLLYHFRVIKVTEKFRSMIVMATVGIMIFYLIVMVARFFGAQMAFMHDSSPLGIGISLFVVGIAALNLLLDFDMIEQGANHGMPKYMEWFGGFALLVTLIWLYLEILRLLSRFASSK